MVNRPIRRALAPVLAAVLGGAVVAAALGAASPATASASERRPAEGREYRLYLTDSYGVDLGACRQAARRDQWRVFGLVDARAAGQDDNAGGLEVWNDGEATRRAWRAAGLDAGRYATGSVLVPRDGRYSIQGYAGIANAGAAVRLRPAAIPAC